MPRAKTLGPMSVMQTCSVSANSTIRATHLVVAIAVLLLEHESDRLVDVDQERSARRRLLVVREAARAMEELVAVTRLRARMPTERERPADRYQSARGRARQRQRTTLLGCVIEWAKYSAEGSATPDVRGRAGGVALDAPRSAEGTAKPTIGMGAPAVGPSGRADGGRDCIVTTTDCDAAPSSSVSVHIAQAKERAPLTGV